MASLPILEGMLRESLYSICHIASQHTQHTAILVVTRLPLWLGRASPLWLSHESHTPLTLKTTTTPSDDTLPLAAAIESDWSVWKSWKLGVSEWPEWCHSCFSHSEWSGSSIYITKTYTLHMRGFGRSQKRCFWEVRFSWTYIYNIYTIIYIYIMNATSWLPSLWSPERLTFSGRLW